MTVFEPFTKITCPSCHESVRVRRKFNHFVIIKQIGEGGMSRVFEAEDETLGRRVALKILNRTYSRDAVRMAQFQNEALITARVTHPNVIKLYSVGHDQGYFYIAMELVTGGSLEQRIKRDGTVKEKDALRIGRQVADGLRAAYRMGLQHRDVKPANILFTDDGTAKVVDFGLALFVEHQDQDQEIWATPFYVSPEKVIENREDFRGDLFSLGATLYHALTGKPPHKANTNSLHELRMIKCRRVALEDTGMPFSPRTIHIVDKLLAFKAEDRPESYDIAVDELRLAEGLTDRSFMPGASRRRKLAIFGTGALVGAFAIGMAVRNIGTKPKASFNTTPIVQESLEGDGVTLSTGQRTIADRFLTARRTLLNGEFKKAEREFDGIIKEGARQPTLNRARFNAALCAMIGGQRKHAEELFGAMVTDANGSDDPVMGFFRALGTAMSKDLGLALKTADLSYDRSKEDSMGYLAHGLAQWQFGDPDQGAQALQRFLESQQQDRTLDWIAQYRSLIGPYAEDLKLVRTLQKPDKDLSPADSNALLAETEQARKQLKTHGRLQEELDRRIARLSRISGRGQTTELRQKMKEQLDHKKRELDQFGELTKTVPTLVRGYDFSPAIRILKEMQFESPEVQSAMDGKLYLYQGAAEFMTQLFKDIAANGWQGSIERREASPISGWVTAATLQDLTISLNRTSSNAARIPLEQVEPDMLIKMAQTFCSTISDTPDYQHRQELIAIFARMQGLTDVASTVATQLMDESRPFRQRWMKVM
ncbi:MAG: Serine/threonine protein kinase [Verrucomicrobiaceae bacterium]|nr:Serine/threonine protein kinase [Verrucomicrobiaceae bacterium]